MNAESHSEDRVCPCVADHNPEPSDLERHHIWPLGQGGPDTAANLVWICSNAHTSVHNLERQWWKAGGPPTWEIRRRYNFFTRELARRAYQSALAQELVP